MTTQPPNSSIMGVDWKAAQNNPLHRTGSLSKQVLIVRRGQSFSLQIQLKHPYKSQEHKLIFTAETGKYPEEKRGTKSIFGIPDSVKRSDKAKAIWSVVMDQKLSNPAMGTLNFTITPPANAPVGKYLLHLNHSGEENELGSLVVLYNPWCTDDWVYMADEAERQEYVMNQRGIIYKGSGNYITSMDWDFAQFEENMVQICLTMLDLSHKHLKDPADDVSARCNPIYVSRIVSAMINSADDRGVVAGEWSGNYIGGQPPTHWSGSYAILQRWLTIGCHPVKYGQCWVFAGVMCSVLRFLGIPCRVVTNFESAHDSNRNLVIDVYHPDYGVRDIPSEDSVWNYHVWVEAWMRRPDLPPGYDGWQVVDPTPQEKSGGVFCCGPAPVKAILNGDTDVKYDVPFVFAEVNADCIDWLVKADGSKTQIFSDTKRVGQNISTKSVGSDKRWNITSNYKYTEGTEKERTVFKYALTRDYTKSDETEDSNDNDLTHGTDNTPTTVNGGTGGGSLNGPTVNGPTVTGPTVTGPTVNGPTVTGPKVTGPTGNGTGGSTSNNGIEIADCWPALPQVTMRFEEVSKPLNGKDVKVNLVLHSEASVPRPLSINTSVTAVSYNGTALSSIQSELRQETLLPGKDLSVPVVVSFSKYWQPMLDSDVMKISAVVSDTKIPNQIYLAESNVVLLDPPIEIKLLNEARVWREVVLEVAFLNPVDETLKQCTLTLSGSGLWREEQSISLPDIRPNTRVRVNLSFCPYKAGIHTLAADFDCSMFRDIKSSIPVFVKDSLSYRY